MEDNAIDIHRDSFAIPKSIKIEQYIYSHKACLKNEYYTYRCKKRKQCGMVIKVSKSELKKYIENNNTIINYEITSKINKHTCENDNNNNKDQNNKDDSINSNKDESEITSKTNLTRALILQNIEKPMAYHVSNFKANNINITFNQLKWKLQQIREEKFPNDNKFLKDISKINISFDNNNINLQNLSMCFKATTFINPKKKKLFRKIYYF